MKRDRFHFWASKVCHAAHPCGPAAQLCCWDSTCLLTTSAREHLVRVWASPPDFEGIGARCQASSCAFLYFHPAVLAALLADVAAQPAEGRRLPLLLAACCDAHGLLARAAHGAPALQAVRASTLGFGYALSLGLGLGLGIRQFVWCTAWLQRAAFGAPAPQAVRAYSADCVIHCVAAACGAQCACAAGGAQLGCKQHIVA